jgi:hypothetical protein
MKTISFFIIVFLISPSLFSQKMTQRDFIGHWDNCCTTDTSYFFMIDVGFADIDFVTNIKTHPIIGTHPVIGTYTLDTTAMQTKIVIDAIQNGAKVKMQSSLIKIAKDTLQINLFNRNLIFVKQKPRGRY